MSEHKHLRVVIEDIFYNDNKLTEELAFRLVNEFRYSNLYIPAKRDDFDLNFIIYEYDDLKLTPLFSDEDEFKKFFEDDNIEIMQNSFELYQNILKTTDLDGYILNPTSEKYLFLKDFVLNIKNIPKTNFYTTDTYTREEIKNLTDLSNPELDEFISNKNNAADYEGLADRLSASTLFTLMVSDEDLSPFSQNGIISLMDIGPRAEMYTDNVGGVYASIFSSKDKAKQVKTDKFRYLQVVNLAMLVNFILSEDMDGLILNLGSDEVLIPRSVLLRYSLGFEKYANDEKLSNTIYYMFIME